jgi:hypothetical protein
MFRLKDQVQADYALQGLLSSNPGQMDGKASAKGLSWGLRSRRLKLITLLHQKQPLQVMPSHGCITRW